MVLRIVVPLTGNRNYAWRPLKLSKQRNQNHMIELQRISKWYNVGGIRTFILKDINLRVAEGQFISIMGPSGSDKSTLLNVIGMLDEPSEGEYFFMGEPVHTL